MNYANEVRAFVSKEFLYGDASSLTDSTSFMGEGIIDSTGIMELVMFLETTFNISVETQELLPSNLDSVNKVARFVANKLGVASPGPMSPQEQDNPIAPLFMYAAQPPVEVIAS
jgi:acyl carrier protein